jgi:DNA-binding XRE family transcriptional regulator
MLSKEQIKAGRAMLDWSQKKLAEKCAHVSEPTIKLIESGKVNSTEATLTAIKNTLEDAGLEFLPQDGVRFRDDLVTVIEKIDEHDNIYCRLLEHVYQTMKGSYGEVLHSFVDNALSPQEVIDREQILRKNGLTFRHLIRHGDNYLLYPLDEYRFLPKGHYLNNSSLVYGDWYAVMINRDDKAIIIHDPEMKRKEFNIIWEVGETPESTSAEVTYE